MKKLIKIKYFIYLINIKIYSKFKININSKKITDSFFIKTI